MVIFDSTRLTATDLAKRPMRRSCTQRANACAARGAGVDFGCQRSLNSAVRSILLPRTGAVTCVLSMAPSESCGEVWARKEKEELRWSALCAEEARLESHRGFRNLRVFRFPFRFGISIGAPCQYEAQHFNATKSQTQVPDLNPEIQFKEVHPVFTLYRK